MLVPINHGICQWRASRVGFPAVTSRPSLYPSLAKSELAVCITRSPRGLTRHRCAYLPLFLPRVSLFSSSRPAAIHPVQDVASIRSACHVLEHEERLTGRMCAREKREGEGEKAKDSIVRARNRERREREREKDLKRNRPKKNEDVIGETSILGEKGRRGLWANGRACKWVSRASPTISRDLLYSSAEFIARSDSRSSEKPARGFPPLRAPFPCRYVYNNVLRSRIPRGGRQWNGRWGRGRSVCL